MAPAKVYRRIERAERMRLDIIEMLDAGDE